MAVRTLAGRWRAGAGIVAAVAAGGTVAYCEDPKSGVGFDPEALERGAKALREINKSTYAKKVHCCHQQNVPLQCSVSLCAVARAADRKASTHDVVCCAGV